jgi:hypothetical protein
MRERERERERVNGLRADANLAKVQKPSSSLINVFSPNVHGKRVWNVCRLSDMIIMILIYEVVTATAAV